MSFTPAAQWRLRVIAAWPMAPKADQDGSRSYAIAHESTSKSCEVTAILDPGLGSSYMSRDLARCLLGMEGLRLAESASQSSQLGQVGTILSCDASAYQSSETFFLGDLKGLDLIFSSTTWLSLANQKQGRSKVDQTTTLPLYVAVAPPDPRTHTRRNRHGHLRGLKKTSKHSAKTHDEMQQPSPLGHTLPHSTSTTTWQSPVSTPTHTLSPPPSYAGSTGSNAAWRETVEVFGTEPSSVQDRIPSLHTSQHLTETSSLYRSVELDHTSLALRSKPSGDPNQTSWIWDPEKQNYYARDRDVNDKWYWYPTDMM